MYNTGNPQPTIRKMFPEVFQVTPKKGEYWFHSTGELCLVVDFNVFKTVVCIHINNEKHTAYHGVDCMDRKATPEEVTEALKKESVRRGYKNGVWIGDIYNEKTKEDIIQVSSDYFDYEKIRAGINQGKMALRDSDGSIIFFNGIWAGIIPTKTIQQAEELLKELGHEIKIVS